MKQKNLQRHKNRFGYTLLEMMVSVAIIATITGSGIAAYVRYSERQKLVSSGSNFVVMLRDAQKKAQSGNKPAACTGTLEGWRVEYKEEDYAIGAVCPNFVISETGTLEDGVVFEYTDTSDTIDFEVLTGKVTGDTNIVLKLSEAQKYNISISPAGGISNVGINP